MSNNSGKGSLVLKLSILVLAFALILVILIPDSIWDEEKIEKSKSQFNMSSIYEAEKHYHRLTNNYTTDIDLLLQEIRNDSSIAQTQQLVQHTQKLRKALDDYLSIPLVKSLKIINQNISIIIEDLNVNERYFRVNENILNEAEQIKIDLSTFSSDVRYPNYSACVTYIDSVSQIRRDLSDYNLQTAASYAANLSEKANNYLAEVETENISNEWQEISARIENFRQMIINDAELVKKTSVGARVKKFATINDKEFSTLPLVNKSESFNSATVLKQQFDEIYQTFLKDFIVTGKRSQFRLSLEDSMVLYISEENFLSPVTQEQYKLIINDDSSDIKVESPLLLEELRAQVKPFAEKMAGFEFLNHYFEYSDSLQAIIKKGAEIKNQLKRNLQITVKNAELKDKFGKFVGSSEFKAASDLVEFVNVVNSSQSYSEIKVSIENARNAVGIFNQVYGGNRFDNIDSLNKDILADLEEYNSILSEIKRLPKGIEKFVDEPNQLNEIVSKIKQKTAANNPDDLLKIQSQLEEAILFAQEGKTERVYLVFEKSFENFGYVFKNVKSWEEEDKD